MKLDAEAGNTKWRDSIQKEMDNLDRLKCFKYHPADHKFPPSEGWQLARLKMIWDIKSEDRRYKSRLVAGGHLIDSSGVNTYSSQVDRMTVYLLFLIAQHKKLDLMTADVGNAFPTAPNQEKVYCVAGEEFGDRKGCMVEIQRALYGLAGSSRAYMDFFADTLLNLGFKPSRVDPDLWMKPNKDGDGYDYIATHVDDLIIVGKTPQEYIALIEQEFALRNVESEPQYYLGTSLTRMQDGKILMNSESYITEVIRKYEEKHGLTLRKQPIPMDTKAHPELDKSPLLSTTQHKEYQHIIGMGQWIVLTGRIDIAYAVSSLARFASGPRQGHLEMARHLMGYLKKYKKKGIIINPEEPELSKPLGDVEVKYEDFTHQYKYYQEELDPYFPKPHINELDINIYSDSDHAHDLVTGRSITGLLAFVGSTPVYWKSKRQTSVHTSTFGAEFTALQAAVELAITLRYHLRSMGFEITKPTQIFVDNKSVCINSTNPSSTLNKKSIALAYHFVRQHQAGDVVSIYHTNSHENYADLLTKPLGPTALKNLLREFMTI